MCSIGRSRLGLSLLGLSLLVLAVFLGACARPTPSPTPVARPTPTPLPLPPTPTAVSEGKMLYDKNCAVCHGPSAEGTATAPAIAGHSMAAMMTQVRNPMGNMPAFPPAQLSNHDLEELAEYIAGLGPARAPVKEWEKAAPETMHHWMALLAIQSNDPQDATHHLRDALTFIQEPKHKAEMEKALKLIAEGNLHDAEHEIEEMAGAMSPSGVTMQRFHLVLAQRWVEAKDAARVKHHLEHFTVRAPEKEKKIAHEALELVEKGDFHGAEHEIEELLKG